MPFIDMERFGRRLNVGLTVTRKQNRFNAFLLKFLNKNSAILRKVSLRIM
jgi:hypothetical protein